MSWIRRYPLASFFVLAYALSWWPWPLYAVGLAPFPVPFFPPGIFLAALIVISLSQGRSGWRELGSRMIRWRVNGLWYAAALGIPLAVAVVAVALHIALGAPVQSLTTLPSLGILPLVFVVNLLNPWNGPLAEEPFWRGFALPGLQAGRSPLAAATILAFLVALWHLPLAATGLFPAIFLLGAFGVQFWYIWLFNRTGGSVWMAILMHTAEGTFSRLMAATASEGPDFVQTLSLYVLATCAAAVCLVVIDREAWQGPVFKEVFSLPRLG
jgi:membrane protease YdiL (CAAX protease family)